VNALLAVGLILFGAVILSHQGLGAWLCLQHLGLAVIASIWGMSCVGLGFPAVRRVLPLIPLGTKVTLAFALGVLLFGLGVAVVGFVGALGTVSYFALLSLGLALGVRPAMALVGTWRRASQRQERKPVASSTMLLVGASTLALTLVYVPTLSPRHLSYDTLWYHLPIAEHYVAAGRIERLAEGWYLGLYPQLASWLYTWALLTPKLSLVGRSLLCMQLEFLIFVGTLATIPPLTRALLTGARVSRPTAHRWSWLVTFAFPSVFLRPSRRSRPRRSVVCCTGLSALTSLVE
jgi:hypothetical protein